MSRFDAYNRVWDHAPQRGLKKLLLLALAKHANALGLSWPGVETLCELTGETDLAYVRRLLGDLVDEQAIAKNPGGGRGNVTVYGLLVGLSPKDTDDLRGLVARARVKHGELTILPENSGAQSTVSPQAASVEPPNVSAENSGAQSTVLDKQSTTISGLQSTDSNPLIVVLKTVDYSFESEAQNPASESAKPPQKHEENSFRTHGGGGGDAAEKIEPTPPGRQGLKAVPRHVAYLRDQGMGAAHLFADCDPEATIADFDARIADNWNISAIVTTWKHSPPRPGAIYERRQRQDAETRPERPAQVRTASRSPRPGEIDYYTKRKA